MPKKKINKRDPPIRAFDLEFIARNDLRNYVALLEKELEWLRRDRAFYSANKYKLVEFLVTTRKASLSHRQDSVAKDSAAEQFVEQLKIFRENYNERQLIGNIENVRTKLEKAFDDFVERSTAGAGHLDEEQSLKDQIADNDKLMEFDQLRCRMSVMEMRKTYQNSLEDMDKGFSKKLESAFRQNLNSCLQANKDFYSDKLRALVPIWDLGDIRNDTYFNEIRRMQDFFHKISSKNSEIILVLGHKLESLMIQEKNININLQQMRRENAALRAARPPVSSSKTPVVIRRNLRSTEDTKKIDKLKYRNEVLSEILRMAKTNLQNLKEQFISATRKIYQTADFKAHVLEELIRTNILMESEEEEIEEVVPVGHRIIQNERKSEEGKDMVNLFTLRLENSDTLFVPPVYHDFWSSGE